jgi:ATP-dependent DNA ligase
MPFEKPGQYSRNCVQPRRESVSQKAYGIVRRSTLWLKPVLVGQFEFREWTPDNHLRHSRFVALRDDKKASEVKRDAKL